MRQQQFQSHAGTSRPFQSNMQQQPIMQQQQQANATPKSEPSLEDMMKQLVTNNLQFQQRNDATIQNLETQIGQLASSLNQLQAQGSSQLPAQTIPNPKGNVSAITLRSGKSLQAEQQHNSNSADFIDSAAATDSAVDVSNFADN